MASTSPQSQTGGRVSTMWRPVNSTAYSWVKELHPCAPSVGRPIHSLGDEQRLWFRNGLEGGNWRVDVDLGIERHQDLLVTRRNARGDASIILMPTANPTVRPW